MIRPVIEALLCLLETEWLLRRHGDRPLPEALARIRFSPDTQSRYTPAEVCRAVDVACTLYVKTVLCLQRSVALAMLLRRHHYPAELIIGARTVPFRAHAWVELEGRVLNDKSYIGGLYRELDRY